MSPSVAALCANARRDPNRGKLALSVEPERDQQRPSELGELLRSEQAASYAEVRLVDRVEVVAVHHAFPRQALAGTERDLGWEIANRARYLGDDNRPEVRDGNVPSQDDDGMAAAGKLRVADVTSVQRSSFPLSSRRTLSARSASPALPTAASCGRIP